MIGKIRPFTLLNYTSQARNLHVLKHNGAKEGKLLFLSILTLRQIMPSPPRVMYHQRSPKRLSDGKFTTAKRFIRQFFRKSWRYMDSYRLAQLLWHENNPHCVPLYRKGLDATETAFAMWIYSSHCKIGSPAKIKRLMGEEALET